MKERLSAICPIDYDQKIYPLMVMGHVVGIKDMISDDILLYDNPEKYAPIIDDPVEPPARPPSRPQGVLNLEFYPNPNQPYESYLHPQRPRGNRR